METEVTTEIKTFPEPQPECLAGVAGMFIKMVEPVSEAHPMAMLMQFLTYFGNIVGRNAYYQVEDSRHYTNINTVIVGSTADGRKGTSYARVERAFKGVDIEHETKCLAGGLTSGEGLLYHVRDAVVKLTDEGEQTIDPGVIDK